MALRSELLKKNIMSNFEWFNPNQQGGKVPIRCVQDVQNVQDEKNGRPSIVKFKMLSTVMKTYKVLVKGGTEAFISHIRIHKIIIADCKVKE